jgi:hypothetical protein
MAQHAKPLVDPSLISIKSYYNAALYSVHKESALLSDNNQADYDVVYVTSREESFIRTALKVSLIGTQQIYRWLFRHEYMSSRHSSPAKLC